MQRWLRKIAILLIFGIGASLTHWFQGRTIQGFQEIRDTDQLYYLPSPAWVAFFSCGYNEAVADIFWGSTLVYFASSDLSQATYNEKGASRYTPSYVETVIQLDPHFKRAYSLGSIMVKNHTGMVSKYSLLRAAAILEKGRDVFPNDGKIAFDLGFYYYFEYREITEDKAEIAKYQQLGMDLFRRASYMDNAPNMLSTLAASLLEKHGLDQLVIDHIHMQFRVETNPARRAALAAKLRMLIGAKAEEDILKSQYFYQAWQRDHHFIPFDIYILLRPQHLSIDDFVTGEL